MVVIPARILAKASATLTSVVAAVAVNVRPLKVSASLIANALKVTALLWLTPATFTAVTAVAVPVVSPKLPTLPAMVDVNSTWLPT